MKKTLKYTCILQRNSEINMHSTKKLRNKHVQYGKNSEINMHSTKNH